MNGCGKTLTNTASRFPIPKTTIIISLSHGTGGLWGAIWPKNSTAKANISMISTSAKLTNI